MLLNPYFYHKPFSFSFSYHWCCWINRLLVLNANVPKLHLHPARSWSFKKIFLTSKCEKSALIKIQLNVLCRNISKMKDFILVFSINRLNSFKASAVFNPRSAFWASKLSLFQTWFLLAYYSFLYSPSSYHLKHTVSFYFMWTCGKKMKFKELFFYMDTSNRKRRMFWNWNERTKSLLRLLLIYSIINGLG